MARAAKDAARGAAGLAARPLARNQCAVRINGADTPWFAADLAVCAAALVVAVALPEAGQDDDLAAVRRALRDTPIVTLVETADGFDRLREIAHAPGVMRWVFGTIDLRLDLGLVDDDKALRHFGARFVPESRLAQLVNPIDGVVTEINWAQRVVTAMGFATSAAVAFAAKMVALLVGDCLPCAFGTKAQKHKSAERNPRRRR